MKRVADLVLILITDWVLVVVVTSCTFLRFVFVLSSLVWVKVGLMKSWLLEIILAFFVISFAKIREVVVLILLRSTSHCQTRNQSGKVDLTRWTFISLLLFYFFKRFLLGLVDFGEINAAIFNIVFLLVMILLDLWRLVVGFWTFSFFVFCGSGFFELTLLLALFRFVNLRCPYFLPLIDVFQWNGKLMHGV